MAAIVSVGLLITSSLLAQHVCSELCVELRIRTLPRVS